MAANMDKQTLEYIMRGITARDRALQRHIADTYLADDVKFTHMLGDVQGRQALYGVYRAAVSAIDYKLRVVDIVLSPDECKAACWLDLNLKLAPFYIKRYHAPTIVMLRWRKDADGLYRITEQIDHHSMFVFMWAFGWPLSAMFDMVTRRLTGRLMSLSGLGLDVVQDCAAAAVSLSSQAVGWGLQQTLPPSLLANVAHLLPASWSALMGLRGQQPAQQGCAPAVTNGMQQHLLQSTQTAPAFGAWNGSEVTKVSAA